MKSLTINMNYSGVQIKANFNNKLNMLSGFSGTGKTFLMGAVELFCRNNKIAYAVCDYRTQDIDSDKIKALCEKADVILLDNADLYLSNDILEWFRKNNKFIIMCMKKNSKIDMCGVTEYLVRYENLNLILEEL